MDPIVAYLKTSEFPENKTEARILRMKVAHYVIYDDKLYKRCYLMSLLKCATPLEADYITREIQEGICGNHTGGSHWHSKCLYKDITGQL